MSSAAVDEVVLQNSQVNLRLNEIQLLLSEKRTSLSALQAGIALLALPLSVVSFLVATSSLYAVTCPLRPQAQPAVRLQFMAVDPMLQRRGIGSAVMIEILRRLRTTGAVLLWASARDTAVPFYRRFGFSTVEGSAFTPRETARPHCIIELKLGSRDTDRSPSP